MRGDWAERMFRIGAAGTAVCAVAYLTPLAQWLLAALGVAEPERLANRATPILLVAFMLLGALGWDLKRKR